MLVTVTPALMDLLRGHRLASATGQGERWSVGDRIDIHRDAVIEPYAHIFRGMVIPRALGAFSYSFSPCDVALSVGRYCSISWSVEMMGSAHPDGWASTSPFSYNPRPIGGFQSYLRDVGGSYVVHAFDQGPQAVTIGHDVWIGASVMLKRGITIGDGAMIGARSLVTRDVPPYAVMAGSPARLLRYRFPDAVIERFQRAAWWRFGPDMVQACDVRDPERFLDRFEALLATGPTPLDLTPLTGAQMIAAGDAG